MKITLVAVALLTAVLGGCTVVPVDYGYRSDGYYRGDRYYRSYSYVPSYRYDYGYGYRGGSYAYPGWRYRDHGQ